MYSPTSEPVTLERDCDAILIPSGDEVQLPAGTHGYITQALGGSFTVFVEGNLFRIDGDDADAIGKEPPPKPQLPENATDTDIETLVWKQLRTCYDPEIPVNIVDLGLIYDCIIDRAESGERIVRIDMTLTAPGCGMGDFLIEDVRSKVLAVPTIAEADVELVFDPPWNQTMMSEEARLEVGLF
ncbi:MAG: putative Fe-S cluster assembly protein SufT [Xanthomonadales bacterium]|nr:putative Fe-S cluster assembly protein SufT [Xanthomonadales bacterium]